VEKIGKGSVVQHGKFNDRIYLMKLARADCPEILNALRGIARENTYTKIFAKVPSWAAPVFFSDGYLMEAFIPRFYRDREAAFFLSKYLDSDRLMGVEYGSLNELGKLLSADDPGASGKKPAGKSKSARLKSVKKFKKSEIIRLGKSDVAEITEVYREVFLSYPFPIHNPGYILKTMKENVWYYGIERKGKLIALASAEIDQKGCNAEMTDFATLPEYRGNSLASIILTVMEKQMKKNGIHTLYTIARLNSMAMNKTFLKLKYTYAGTLIRNTNIAGKIESMNVYYKHV
jgi:putative beta-lysine N-acetyltransferase